MTLFKEKYKILEFFIKDIDSVLGKILNIKNLHSNFKPSIIGGFSKATLYNEIHIIDNYL